METVKPSKEQESSSREIPFDLIPALLSRVPAMNLIRFNCASKQWNSLIQDPAFAQLHLRQSEEKDTRKLIKICRKDNKASDPYHTRIYSIDMKGIASPIHPKPYVHRFSYTPSCNGLLCYISPALNVQVSNPVTGETITLPKPRPSFLQNLSVNEFGNESKTVIAIGFDRRLKVYKIVGWNNDGDSEVEIFTLGANSWRKISGSPVRTVGLPVSYRYCEPVYVDGVTYWYGGHRKNEIFSFDYVEEKFGTVKVPDEIINSFNSDGKCWLCESRGRLCIVEKQKMESEKRKREWVITLWLLNKYEDGRQAWSCQPPIIVKGVKKIKSKIVSIGNGEIMMDPDHVGFFLDSYNEQGKVNTIRIKKSHGVP